MQNPDGMARTLIRRRIKPFAPLKVADLRRSERCREFEVLRLNRKVFGAFRYGRIREEDKPHWRCVESCIARLRAYQKDGNLEHLVDVANICEVEFAEGRDRGQIVDSIDDGIHTQEKL